jgi:hypothetical protein
MASSQAITNVCYQSLNEHPGRGQRNEDSASRLPVAPDRMSATAEPIASGSIQVIDGSVINPLALAISLKPADIFCPAHGTSPSASPKRQSDPATAQLFASRCLLDISAQLYQTQGFDVIL